MREWLGRLLPGSLLILDEAHHAAPASGGRYGIETRFTRAVRDLAHRFEHRLFLSATPHNGHSDSFSTLLELLDPYRFTRGVKVQGKRALEAVMVRRLKEDIRAEQGGFPLREVKRIPISDLPGDAPELELSRLLDQYRTARERRYTGTTRRSQAAAGLLIVGLQQRLLSSIEAFARSLAVHRATVEKQWRQEQEAAVDTDQAQLFVASAGADDERATWTVDEAEADEAAQTAAATRLADAHASGGAAATTLPRQEQLLLDRMHEVADSTRHLPDAKTRYLIDWIREYLCPDLPPYGESGAGAPARWNNRRVLIFTESREGTKRYLRTVLEQAIAETDRAEERIEVIDGLTSGARRKEAQRRFNTDPTQDPLRILLATDAAREGLNFQAHCTDLFHFDLPWNPGRIEQRNGRIDRKLQPADQVRCHYFVLTQRPEDRVLEVLVRKTETIKRELGSLSQVIDDEIERRLRGGIPHDSIERLAREIERQDLDRQRKQLAEEELEAARDRQAELRAQIDRCRDLLDASRTWTRFEPVPFRDALSCSLQLSGADALVETVDRSGSPVWTFPDVSRRVAADPSWATAVDTLRAPRKQHQSLAEWRQEAPVRPVVFADASVLTEDTVHLHLEHRLVQRLLARFRSQGFIHHDLARACLLPAADAIPRVVLLGRLSLYGRAAERLHEELVPVTARWLEPSRRRGPLAAYGREAETRTLDLLERALAAGHGRSPAEITRRRLLQAAQHDTQQLRPHLKARADDLAKLAAERLARRGRHESDDLRAILERQRKQVRSTLEQYRSDEQLSLNFDPAELRQLQANMKAWESRLREFDRELLSEPERVRAFYDVQAQRIEPVGIVYLWPESN